ncbi:MAG: YdeI/OmpD-associated family protein [Saprospiraceae bacterium]
MSSEKPLVDRRFLLEKFPGKGGWTFARLPEISSNQNRPFGWVTVKGKIDDYELNKHKLMPMGDGSLFFSVKAAIRKKIGKQVGDYVHLCLFADEGPTEIPSEIQACFEQEAPNIQQNFLAFSPTERQTYLNWIYEAKTEEDKAQRILKMMTRLQRKLRCYDREK